MGGVKLRLLAFFLLLPLLIGCEEAGPETFPVSGIVYYKEKPLPYGLVLFFGPGGNEVGSSKIGKDGTYSLDAVPGQNRIAVSASPPIELKPGENLESVSVRRTKPKKGQPVVPVKFASASTSGLSCEVVTEENTIDIRISR